MQEEYQWSWKQRGLLFLRSFNENRWEKVKVQNF